MLWVMVVERMCASTGRVTLDSFRAEAFSLLENSSNMSLRAWPRSVAVVVSRRIPSSMERACRRFQEARARIDPTSRLLDSGSGIISMLELVLVGMVLVGGSGGVGFKC